MMHISMGSMCRYEFFFTFHNIYSFKLILNTVFETEW